MRVGPAGAHVSITGGLPKAVDRAVGMGAECLQIFSSPPLQWLDPRQSPEAIQEFNHLTTKESLGPVFVHAKYLINLASPNPVLVRKSVEAIGADFRLVSQINAVGVIVHLGSHLGQGYQKVKDQLAGSIREILAQTPDQGMFIIENSAGQRGKICSHIDEIYDLLSLFKTDRFGIQAQRLAICLDSCHLWTAGYDLKDKESLNTLVNQLAQMNLLERTVALHVNDSRDPLGSGRDRHANLGEGEIGLKGLKNFVTHEKFIHLPKIIETPGFAAQGPDAENIEILKSLISR